MVRPTIRRKNLFLSYLARARTLTRAWTKSYTGIEAVMLTGGVSRGYADEMSELDLTLFLHPATYRLWIERCQSPLPEGDNLIGSWSVDLYYASIARERKEAWSPLKILDRSFARVLYDPRGRLAALLRETRVEVVEGHVRRSLARFPGPSRDRSPSSRSHEPDCVRPSNRGPRASPFSTPFRRGGREATRGMVCAPRFGSVGTSASNGHRRDASLPARSLEERGTRAAAPMTSASGSPPKTVHENHSSRQALEPVKSADMVPPKGIGEPEPNRMYLADSALRRGIRKHRSRSG